MDLLKPLIALLAIVNPIGVVPFFIHLTQAFTPKQRSETMRISAFTASGRIAKVPSRTGIRGMTRLMGLILAAMAVELLADGMVKLFPVLAAPLTH